MHTPHQAGIVLLETELHRHGIPRLEGHPLGNGVGVGRLGQRQYDIGVQIQNLEFKIKKWGGLRLPQTTPNYLAND